jgi:hypothetical protein
LWIQAEGGFDVIPRHKLEFLSTRRVIAVLGDKMAAGESWTKVANDQLNAVSLLCCSNTASADPKATRMAVIVSAIDAMGIIALTGDNDETPGARVVGEGDTFGVGDDVLGIRCCDPGRNRGTVRGGNAF